MKNSVYVTENKSCSLLLLLKGSDFLFVLVFAIEGVSANCCMGFEPANIEIAAWGLWYSLLLRGRLKTTKDQPWRNPWGRVGMGGCIRLWKAYDCYRHTGKQHRLEYNRTFSSTQSFLYLFKTLFPAHVRHPTPHPIWHTSPKRQKVEVPIRIEISFCCSEVLTGSRGPRTLISSQQRVEERWLDPGWCEQQQQQQQKASPLPTLRFLLCLHLTAKKPGKCWRGVSRNKRKAPF